MESGRRRPNMWGMRQTAPIKRYSLARSGTTAKARPEEGVRRLRLIRMEAIAQADHDRERAPRGRA
jgi:hypothetical protein